MIRSSQRVPRQPLRRIFALPALLFVTTLIGLILGLTGEGWRDVIAVALLFLPLAFVLRSKGNGGVSPN